LSVTTLFEEKSNCTKVSFQAPAPRLSRTPAVARVEEEPPEVGQHSLEILKSELSLSDADLKDLVERKVVKQSSFKSNL
jgi:hypothetical protein